MSVINTKEMFSNTPWRVNSTPGKPFDRTVTTVRRFTTVVDDPEDTRDVIQNSIGINIGDSHPDAPSVFVTNVTNDRVTPYYYLSTYTYFGVGDEDRLLRPMEIRWDSVESSESIDVDAMGQIIATANGEGFDPPLTRPFSDLTLSLNRNEAFYPTLLIMDYLNTVNQDVFWGFPPGTVLLKRAPGVKMNTSWQVYVNITYSFQIRVDAWLARILHKGTIERAIDADGVPLIPPQYRRIKNADGTDSEAQLLDINGARIPLDEFGNPTQPIVWQYFNRYGTRLFSALGLE